MILTNREIPKDKVAILSKEGRQMSYEDLNLFSQNIGPCLQTRSLSFVMCDFSIDTLSYYYALLDNKLVPVLLDQKLDIELLLRLMNIYEPQYIWLSKKYLDENHQIFWDESYSIIADYENHVCIKLSYDIYPVAADLALLLETSGSTGSRKFVRVSYENLMVMVQSIAQFVEADKDDRYIVTMPYNHALNLVWIHMHWYFGGTILLTDSPLLSTKFWDFFREQRVTNFVGVPFVFDILEKINFLKGEYPCLKYILEAGGKISGELQKKYGLELSKKGIKMYISYGLTEATALVSMLPSDQLTAKLGSVGIPMKGVSITIDQDSNEIIVEGKCVCMGYAQNRQDLLLGEGEKRWNTGDIGEFDKDGYLYITGRKKRFVKVSGSRINLDDVERLLGEMKEFGNCVCTGTGELIHIFTDCPQDGIESEIIKFLAKKIHINKLFIKTRYICEIPRTSSGKVRYGALIEK